MVFGSKSPGHKRFTRIFFATDVHGSDRTFHKFLNAGAFYKADVLVLGGDITGKLLVPIVEQADGTFRSQFLGQDSVLKTPNEVDELSRRIRDTGFYPYPTNFREMEEFTADGKKLQEVFTRLMFETLEKWVKLADQRLGDSAIRCYVTGGNDDPLKIDSVLRHSHSMVYSEDVVQKIDDMHEMISCGYGNPTPWNCPRDISEDELSKKIDKVASQVTDTENCIFNLHVPPKDTPLDQAPKLDESVVPPRPITNRGQLVMFGAGSTAVRAAIEKYQPLLGLHGHIHEVRAETRIGRSFCVNPGSEYGEGILRGALVNVADKKVLSCQFTSG